MINNIRESDIIGRVGGEEFIIALPNTNIDIALNVSEKLRKTTEEFSISINDNLHVSITISIGISFYNGSGSYNIDQIIKNADNALYRSKQNGRNQVSADENCMQYSLF